MAKKIEVQIVGDASKLSKAFNQAGDSGGKFGKNMMKVGKFAALGLAGAGAAAAVAGKKMIDMASDAAEVQSKMEVVFGKSLPTLTKEIDKFSAATGTSKFAMREQAADMGALLRPMLGSQKGAAKMSLQFTKLATDLGSFNNIPAAEALEKIRAGLVGESEPLRALGVLLTAATTKEFAYANGIAKRGVELTEAQKVEARAGQIMAQTALAQGDATRTAGSMANQMKALKTNVSDAATEIGMALIPHALRAVQAFNEHWPTILRISKMVFDGMGRVIEALAPVFTGLINAIRRIVAVAQESWPRVQEAAAKVMAWYRGTLQPAIENVIKALTAIWNRFGGDITKIATTAFNTVKGVITAALNIIQGVVEGVLAVIRGDWTQAWNSLKKVVSNVFAGIKVILAGFPAIAFRLMMAVGAALVDGIVAGLVGLASRLKDFLIDQITSGINAAKAFFGIDSPSKYTRDQIGRPLADGITEGMANGLAVLKAQVAPALDAIAKMMADKAKAAREKFERTFDGMSGRIMRSFEAIRGAISTPAEAALRAISDRRQEEDLQKALQDALAGGDPEAIARAQEDIQIASLQRQAEAERTALDQQTEAMRDKLTTKLEMMGKVWKGGTADILKLLEGFGVDFATVGSVLGTAFRQSLIASINGASTAAGGKGGVKNTAGAGGGAPIVVQTYLDGKLVAESTRNHNAIYARANGLPAV